MNLYNFIYSTNSYVRCCRHLTFWLARWLFLWGATTMNDYLLYDRLTSNLVDTLLNAFATTLCEVLYTYTIVYVVLPRLLFQKKYMAFVVVFSLSTLLTIFLMRQAGSYFDAELRPFDWSFWALWGMFWGYTGYGAPVVCGLFIVIKTLKVYNKKVEEKEQLLKENNQAESQFLKAQIHPHFLFNTLNSIYSYALNRSSYALHLLENLGRTMQYMITDCEAALVPVEKELKIIRDYIELEKVRYGSRLSSEIDIEGESRNKMIDPLLIIPLIENCIKHGASQIIGESWIKLHIFIKESAIDVEVSNNMPLLPLTPNKKGIGLANIRKRLELLHPGDHLLEIRSLKETFTVHMQVPLELLHA